MTRTIEDPRMTESMLVLGLNGETVGEMRVRKTREGKPKSRNGCRTCKLRRVKCDETKPHCMRCTRFGQRCDGYIAKTPNKQSLQISTTRTLAPRSANPTPNHAEAASASSGLSPGGMGMGGGSGSSLSPSPIDGFMPGGFGRRSPQNMDGNGTSNVNEGRREEIALGMSSLDPWAALIQTICSRDDLLDSTLRRVNNAITTPSLKTSGGMIQDFLFFIFDRLGDRADEQVLGGLRVLRDEALKSMPTLKDRVEKEYIRLEDGYLHATMGVGAYIPIANDMSHTFETISEARTSLEIVIRRCKYHLRSENNREEKEDVINDLKRWDLAYGPLLKFARSKGASEDDFLAASLLRLSWLAGWLCISSGFGEVVGEGEKRQVRIDVDEMTYIAELLCRKMVPDDEEMGDDVDEKGTWAWDMQICIPAMVVGWVCQQPEMRRMAGEMLAKSARREGVRDGVLIGRVLQWLEAVEGENCRVDGIRLAFDKERKMAMVRCLQSIPGGLVERKGEIPW